MNTAIPGHALSSLEERMRYAVKNGETSWAAVAVFVAAVAVLPTVASIYSLDDTPGVASRNNTSTSQPVLNRTSTSERTAVQTCNDREVIVTLIDGTVGRYKTAILKQKDSLSDEAVQTVNTLKASINNISQIAFDPANSVRTCVAEFSYTAAGDLAIIDAITPQMRLLDRNIQSLCPQQVTYQVRRLLDRPGQFQVQWQCD